MFHTRTTIEYRAGTAAAVLSTMVGVDKFADESSERGSRLAAEEALDQVLAFKSGGGFETPTLNRVCRREMPSQRHARYHRCVPSE